MTARGDATVMDWRREIAGGYERSWRFYRPYVALCLRWGEPGRWLDLGAGLGYFTECCQRYGIPCRGYEGSAFAVAEARARHAGVDLREHDLAAGLPEPDGAATVVFCNQVIEHLEPEGMLSLLREARRVLAPGGLLYVGSPSRFNRGQIKDEHINLLAPRELHRALVTAGFDEVWAADYPRAFPGPSALGKLLAGALFLVAPLDRLSMSANALAFVAAGGEAASRRPRIRGSRSFHLRRLLGW